MNVDNEEELPFRPELIDQSILQTLSSARYKIHQSNLKEFGELAVRYFFLSLSLPTKIDKDLLRVCRTR